MARHRTPHTRRLPRPALAALAAVAALIVTGCNDGAGGSAPSQDQGSGSSSAPARTPGDGSADDPGTGTTGSTSTPASTPPGSRPPGLPRCAPTALSAALRELQPGAGNRYAALVLTNTSATACRTQGWPGLQLTSEGGSTLRTETTRDRSAAARQVVLKPGGHAWTRLHWTVVAGTGDPADGSCPDPDALRVIPPDERRPLTADWRLGTVCGTGEIEATALQPGTGPAH